MRVNPEDRTEFSRSSSKRSRYLLLAFAALLIAAGAYYFLANERHSVQQQPESVSLPEQGVSPLPEIPVIDISEPDFILPALDESDGDFRTRLIDVSEELAPWLQSEELIRRGVTFNDGLSRGEVLTNLLSFPAPQGRFRVVIESDGIYLSEENYQRYEYLKKIFVSTDIAKLVDLFHLFRPLLERAYAELGYEPTSLGASIVFTLDKILATPVIDKPVRLELETVHYSFANPELEKLSPLQKQLLRMGPETTRIVQEKARILKQSLLPPEAEQQAPDHVPAAE